LQGEGPSAGRPSLFVRLSRCNLACVWCDTAYTWNFTGRTTGNQPPRRDALTFEPDANQVRLAEADAAARILALPGAQAIERLVVTGGEPLLQAPALARLLGLLKAARPALHVEVETNGTVAPPAPLDGLIDQYNVSPKLAHSGNPAALALPPERLAAWAGEPRAFFKFVVAEPADLDQVLALQRHHAIPAERLFVMPEGTDARTLRARMAWLAPACLDHGWRLSDRLHIHLYGDTRGT
jgi:organic radical activating enzyme